MSIFITLKMDKQLMRVFSQTCSKLAVSDPAYEDYYEETPQKSSPLYSAVGNPWCRVNYLRISVLGIQDAETQDRAILHWENDNGDTLITWIAWLDYCPLITITWTPLKCFWVMRVHLNLYSGSANSTCIEVKIAKVERILCILLRGAKMPCWKERGKCK